ncbi:MAG: nuclear transport factor 2 family protein [Alphaproteobacteria bacterium]
MTASKPDAGLEAALQDIVDRADIAKTIQAHSRGIDRGDGALINSVYKPGAEVAYGFFNGPATGLANILAARDIDAPVSLHRPSNVWIEVDGNRAKSESYIWAYTPTPTDNGHKHSIFGGRYLDRHEKQNGTWCIAHRTYVLDWNVQWPETGSGDPHYDDSIHNRGGNRGADPGTQLLDQWQSEMNAQPTKETSMNDDLIRKAEEALAKQDIHTIILGQARAIDRGDRALMDSLWWPGASVNVGVFEGPATEFADMILGFTADRPAMSHHVTNEWIEVRGDHAVAETYVIAFSKVPEEDGFIDNFVGGRYLDKFEKRGGTWKCTHRTFVMDWESNQPTTDQGEDGMLADLKTRGGKVPNDPVYDFWAA